MKFSRRDFLTFAGFTVLGVAGGRYLKNQIMPRESYYLGSDFRRRKEEIKSGICGMCPAGCSTHVRLIDGLPVKLDGNPDCPVSRGRLCPKGQMGLELHYNPDRIKAPLRRIGSSGSETWEQLTWDEALAVLAAKIGPALTEGVGNGVAVICHDEQTIGSQLWTEFQSAYTDRCRLVRLNLLRDRGILPALKLTVDKADWPVYDIENSDFLLVFDTPVFSGWSTPTLQIGKYAAFRRGRERIRGKVVFVGSRRSMDATNADLDIRVMPYTSAVLALGLAHVLIRERRYDESFVSKYCSGFDDLKAMVLKYFRPKMVNEITGVSVETIHSVARMFASSDRPLALGERIPEATQAWEQTAYLLLNALKGSIGVKGGLLFQERLGLAGTPPADDHDIDLRHADRSPLEKLSAEIMDGGAAPDVLMVDKVEPSATVQSRYRWSDILKRVPFVVSFSPYPNFTTSMADLVLPDLDFLEKPSDFVHPPALGYPSVVVSDPVAKPRADGMDTEVVQSLLLDERLVSEGVVDQGKAKDLLKKKRTRFHRNLFKAHRGLIFDTRFTREWVRRMESGGWWASDAANFEDFQQKLLTKGGWTDPHVVNANSANQILGEARKFDMKRVADTLPLQRILGRKLSPAPPVLNDQTSMTLTIVPTTLLSVSSLPYGNIPHLLEFPEPGIVTGWEPWLEIHSQVAAALELQDEDMVSIIASGQERRCRILINDGLHPNVGAFPFGMFGLGDGRWIKDNMKTPLESVAGTESDDARPPGIRVQIRKVQ